MTAEMGKWLADRLFGKRGGLSSPLEQALGEGVRAGVAEAVPTLVNTVLHAFWEHQCYPFLSGAHVRLIEAGMKPVPAYETAKRVLTAFLRDEGVKFGDPRFAWDAAAGRTLAEEYEIQYWEATTHDR